MPRLLLAIILAFMPFCLWAFKLNNLYQVEIPVETQSEAERENATKHALEQLLVRLSGDRNVEKNAFIRTQLNHATNFIQEFSYGTASDSKSPYLLRVHFSEAGVNNLLKKAGVVYWNQERPLTLVWLTISDENDSSEIIGNESPESVLGNIKEQANLYGLPLIFPMMDMTDVEHIGINDIQNFQLSTLQLASKRYSPTALLIGNIQQTSNGFKSEWQLVLKNNQLSFTVENKKIENVIAAVLNQVSQTFIKMYAKKPALPIRVILEVSNVTENKDLKELMAYLKQVTSIRQIDLAEISGDVVNLSIETEGTLDSFEQNTAIGQRLILKSKDITNNKLQYDWVHEKV